MDGVSRPVPHPAPLALPDACDAYLARIADCYAERTIGALRADLRGYLRYSEGHRPPFPVTDEQLLGYLTFLADSGYRWSTLRRRLASLRHWHVAFEHPGFAASHEVRLGLRRLRRRLGPG